MPKKKRFRIVIIILLFLVYFFLAARPIPREVILAPEWISSLTDSLQGSPAVGQIINPEDAGDNAESILFYDSGAQETRSRDTSLFPFTLGSHFGYIDSSGQFAVNRVLSDNIYLGRNMWTEYGAQPVNIQVKNILEEIIINIPNPRGYPVLLDERVFILGSEQNSLSEIDNNGNILWTYEFGAPLTCIDARAGLVLTGSLDGVIEIFNSAGERIFYFEPGGSRYEVILGCAISSDGSRIGIISGIDQQRFILLERFGNIDGDYKVVYHEYLDAGFRRPVRILFIDEDKRLIFERTGGIGCYNIRNRRTMFIPLDGAIYTIEEAADQGFLFIVVSTPDYTALIDEALSENQTGIVPGNYEKKLIGIKFPQDRLLPFLFPANTDAIFLTAPFKSDVGFLGRNGPQLVVGGGTVLVSFNLEEK